MITIIDIGCRYGVFHMFKHCYEKFRYIGVDADSSEINRLNKKYKGKNILFESAFLSSRKGAIAFIEAEHKGYSSSKKMNTNSLWFGLVRNNEVGIKKQIEIESQISGDWIDANTKTNLLLKLDIEGGELDFLDGLDKRHYNKIEGFVVEAHFDTPYDTDSNFSTIYNRLQKNGYWLASAEIESEKVTKFSELKDTIPICSTAIFLKERYKPFLFDSEDIDVICEVLYSLRLEALLLKYCRQLGYAKLKELEIFYEIKYLIGHKFNRLKKDISFDFDELNREFLIMFDEELPKLSDFYESDFFNPV